MPRIFRRTETLLAITLAVICLIIGILNPVFLTTANLFNLLRAFIVLGIFAMGSLMVMISGGIDVSFTAIAVFAMYSSSKILIALYPDSPVWIAIVISAVIGLGLGLINAFFISTFNLPTLIVTLATLSMFHGFLLFVIGNDILRDAPESYIDFARSSLATVPTESGGTASLHPAILITVVVIVGVWFFLDYTMLGRGVYALGGARDAAERAGFSISGIQYTIYGLVGLLAGVAGMIFGALNRQPNPQDIVGTELTVIAAVVLGGASLTGGRGTVLGTILGVILIVVLNNSLNLIGVPPVWQRVVIGAVILIGTGIPALQAQRDERRGPQITARHAEPRSPAVLQQP
ncbi:MAG: ABC transporter permease [Caldilineaceae bacterium]